MSKEKKAPPRGKSGRTEPAGSLRSAGRRLERYRAAGLVAVEVVLLLVVFFQVNYLGCRRHTTWDLTENRRFTLSETTGKVLADLGDEVRVVMAFLASSELHAEVKGLLAEYDRLGGDRVVAEYLDLSRSRSRLAELKDRHQLEFGGDQIVLLAANGRIKTIRADELVNRDPATGRVDEFRGEEVLTAALLEVTEQRQKKIYLVTGDRRADALVRIAKQLQPLVNAQNARLEGLVLEGRDALPEDADVLFFPGNSEDLTSRELALVREYWEGRRGGLVIFLDPAADTPNLNSLLREHGVAPRGDRVLSVLSIPGVAARKTYDVPVALMPGEGPTRDLPALSLRLLGQTQSIEVLAEDDLLLSENIRPRPLMIAATGFWGETDFGDEEVSFNPAIDHGQPDPVYTAASVERGEPGDPGLTKGTSRLVVVGNADLVSPQGNTSQVAADFALSALNWVMNRETLVGISPKRPTLFALSVEPARLAFLQSLLLFVLPGTALLAAGFVWMRRRA